MNQYKERIKRLRDKYNAEIAASFSFYDEPEYTAHLPFPPDDDEHADACAEIVADAYRKGDYAHMWEALNEAYMTVDGFVAIGCIAYIECILGRAHWLRTKPIEPLSRARPTF